MKQIVAGSGTCSAYKLAGNPPSSSVNYSASSVNQNNGSFTYYGISAAEAQWLVSGMAIGTAAVAAVLLGTSIANILVITLK